MKKTAGQREKSQNQFLYNMNPEHIMNDSNPNDPPGLILSHIPSEEEFQKILNGFSKELEDSECKERVLRSAACLWLLRIKLLYEKDKQEKNFEWEVFCKSKRDRLVNEGFGLIIYFLYAETITEICQKEERKERIQDIKEAVVSLVNSKVAETSSENSEVLEEWKVLKALWKGFADRRESEGYNAYLKRQLRLLFQLCGWCSFFDGIELAPMIELAPTMEQSSHCDTFNTELSSFGDYKRYIDKFVNPLIESQDGKRSIAGLIHQTFGLYKHFLEISDQEYFGNVVNNFKVTSRRHEFYRKWYQVNGSFVQCDILDKIRRSFTLDGNEPDKSRSPRDKEWFQPRVEDRGDDGTKGVYEQFDNYLQTVLRRGKNHKTRSLENMKDEVEDKRIDNPEEENDGHADINVRIIAEYCEQARAVFPFKYSLNGNDYYFPNVFIRCETYRTYLAGYLSGCLILRQNGNIVKAEVPDAELAVRNTEFTLMRTEVSDVAVQEAQSPDDEQERCFYVGSKELGEVISSIVNDAKEVLADKEKDPKEALAFQAYNKISKHLRKHPRDRSSYMGGLNVARKLLQDYLQGDEEGARKQRFEFLLKMIDKDDRTFASFRDMVITSLKERDLHARKMSPEDLRYWLNINVEY